MTKRFTKMISLMAVVMVMMVSMAIPAFATDVTCTWNATTKTSTASGEPQTHKGVCQALGLMYGDAVKGYSTDATNTQGNSYGLTLTVDNVAHEIFINRRPDVNDVKVQMGTDGRLNVYGMGTGDANTWNQFFAKYKSVIVGISGVGAITFIALFIIQFMKLGASAGNPQARSQALTGCLWTGIAAAALGAVSIIAGFFYNAV